MTETFHVGDLLTVMTGRLVSPTHVDGLYRIVDYITGQPHFTHHLPRGADACKPHLLEQHPWLAEVTVPDSLSGEAAVKEWLAGVVARYGEFHEVEPMPFGAYVGRDPIVEMQEMVGKDKVIAVQMPEPQRRTVEIPADAVVLRPSAEDAARLAEAMEAVPFALKATAPLVEQVRYALTQMAGGAK